MCAYLYVCFICLCVCVLCGFLCLVFLLFLIYANIDRVREAAKKYATLFLFSASKSNVTHTHTYTVAGIYSEPLLIVSCRVVSGPITRAVRDLG